MSILPVFLWEILPKLRTSKCNTFWTEIILICCTKIFQTSQTWFLYPDPPVALNWRVLGVFCLFLANLELVSLSFITNPLDILYQRSQYRLLKSWSIFMMAESQIYCHTSWAYFGILSVWDLKIEVLFCSRKCFTCFKNVIL